MASAIISLNFEKRLIRLAERLRVEFFRAWMKPPNC